MRYSHGVRALMCTFVKHSRRMFLRHSSATVKSLKSIDVVALETERRDLLQSPAKIFFNSLLNNERNSTIKRLKLNGSSEHRTLCNYISHSPVAA